MSKAAAAFNATMNAQATGGGSGPAVIDLEGRVARLETIINGLREHPDIAEAIEVAEEAAAAEHNRQRIAAEQAAAEAAEREKADKMAQLRAQLAQLEASGEVPSPQAVAAGFNPGAADG